MQLVNFCLEPFVQHVECGSVCADGYSAHNLISTDSLLRSRGCQVEHFIRPPLHIQFHFSAPLHVACILIQPSLADNAETRIEIAGSVHSPGGETYHYKPCCGSTLIKGENSVLVLRNKVFERKFGEIMFSPDLSVLGSYMDSRLMCLPLIEQPLKHSNVLYTLKCLKVAITQFTGHKPAAIKALEVWATPSSNCSALERQVTQRLIAGLHVRPPSGNPLDCMGVYNSHRQHESSPLEENFADRKFTGRLTSGNELRGYFKGGTVHAESSFSAAESSDYRMSNAHLEGCCNPTGMKEDRHTKGLVGGRQFQRIHMHPQAATQLDPSNSSWSVGKPCLLPEMPVGRLESFWDSGDQCITSCSHFRVGRSNLEASPCCSLSMGLPGPSTPQQGVETHRGETPNKDIARGEASGGRNVRCSGGKDTIPEKFLDEITFEVMAVPMLLPSGHYVDKNTLDKLLHTNAIYGRAPSDPFTGLPFTDSSKPTFCVQMKLQLDRFLSTWGEGPLPKGGRTAGSATDITKHLQKLLGQRMKRTSNEQTPTEGQAKRPKLMSTEEDECFCAVPTHLPLLMEKNTSQHSGAEQSVRRKLSDNNKIPPAPRPALQEPSIQGHATGDLWPMTSPDDQRATSRMLDHTHEVEVACSLNKALQACRDLSPSH